MTFDEIKYDGRYEKLEVFRDMRVKISGLNSFALCNNENLTNKIARTSIQSRIKKSIKKIEDDIATIVFFDNFVKRYENMNLTRSDKIMLKGVKLKLVRVEKKFRRDGECLSDLYKRLNAIDKSKYTVIIINNSCKTPNI